MSRNVVWAILIALLVGIVFLASHMKEAYKVLPISTSKTLEIPPYADWREFIAHSDRFKALLPAPPQYAKEAVLIPNSDQKRLYEMYASEKMNGSIFMINLITYPADYNTSDEMQLLRDTVDETMATNPANQLKNLEETFYQNRRAIHFAIVNHDFHIEGLAFMIEKTVYLLTYVAKESDFDESEYQHFIDSFQLLDPIKDSAE